MRVKVESCWSGGNNYHFRCTVVSGQHAGDRVNVGRNSDGDSWSRAASVELRDHLVNTYGVRRDSIRCEIY